jgi:trimethylamine:corrinoid methyltransferase-like protein
MPWLSKRSAMSAQADIFRYGAHPGALPQRLLLPVLSDWRNYETWQLAGSPTAIEKANRVWKERLASYEAPYMDPAIREELDAFVEKRIAEGGAPTDF